MPAAAGATEPITPERILDTRTGLGVARAGDVPGHGTVRFQVTGRAGVPTAGAAAVMLNLTVVAGSAGGYLTAYPGGSTRPGTSSLNFAAHQVIANQALVRLGADGTVSIYNSSPAALDIVADVDAFYLGGTPSVGGAMRPIGPARLLDTRVGLGAKRGAVGPKGTVAVPVAGRVGIPARGASAVVVNLTVTQPSRSGYITAWADGTSSPTASVLNFTGRQTIAVQAVVPIGADGRIALYNGSSGTVQLVADVLGYYVAGAPTSVGAVAPLTPQRALDTRIGVGAPRAAISSRGTLALQLAGRASVPGDGASAVLLSVTATQPAAAGYLTISASGWHAVSTLNFHAGQTIANAVLVRLDSGGAVHVFNASAGSVQVVIDVMGYVRGDRLTWSAPTPGSRTYYGRLTAVSCADTSFCVAVGGNGRAVTYQAGTWSTPVQAIPYTSDTSALAAMVVSCVAGPFCAAGGNGQLATTQDGLHWTSVPSSLPSSRIMSLSCASATFCVVTDFQGNLSIYDGTTWSTPLQVLQATTWVSCPSITHCVALAADGATAVFDGTSWQVVVPAQPNMKPAPRPIACPSTSLCYAPYGTETTAPYGTDMATFDGTTWAVQAVGVVPTGLTSLSCPATTACVGTVAPGFAMTFDGTSWTEQTSGPSNFTGVSCPSGTWCTAVDTGGNSLTLDNGTWTAPVKRLPSGGYPILASCPTPGFCIGADNYGSVETYDQSTASDPVNIDPVGFGALSCPSTTFCIALDVGGRAMTFDGTSWSGPVVVDSAGVDAWGLENVALSCPTSAFCIALISSRSTSAGYATSVRYSNGQWDTPVPLTANQLLHPRSLSCASATFCIAAGHQVMRYNGTAWSTATAPTPGEAEGIASVYCWTATHCLGLGDRSGWFSFDGHSWAHARYIWPGLGGSLACSPSGDCIVDENSDGRYVRYDGSTWSVPRLLPTAPAGVAANANACSGPRFCLVTTWSNQVTWSS